MKHFNPSPTLCALLLWLPTWSAAFTPPQARRAASAATTSSPTMLSVSIGLGPEENKIEKVELVAGVDYEIPHHEDYRLTRRSPIDEDCDAWFQALVDDGRTGCLGAVAAAALTKLTTPVPLENDVERPAEDAAWTPYVSTRLPWTPLVPAYGLEVFGLPVPRRNAETWRHFDVSGLVRQSYGGASTSSTSATTEGLSTDQVAAYQATLQTKGVWLDNDACQGRLVYINGRFVPELSKTSTLASNLDAVDGIAADLETYLDRLTDGFTDTLAVPVPCNDDMLTSYQKLSVPDHNLGAAYSQFAVNTQQGTAAFAALNTYKTQGVALVHAPAEYDAGEEAHPLPVLVIQAQTACGGLGSDGDDEAGVAFHPRTLVVAEEGSRLSVVQSTVDLDEDLAVDHRPKLFNGYTQVFVKGSANVTHSYLEESAGMVTSGVEKADAEFGQGVPPARTVEAARPQLKDTHLEAIDVHVIGQAGAYEGTVMCMGGSGHTRVALSVSLLATEAFASVNGFCLAGGAQRTDIKTNIHHVAQGTKSRQLQKSMVGGRATGSFRGRIRVEQSAQQTDSEQLSRTILLSDKSRAWAVPSLEIIADDVVCAHGATVSDLSEEELFYLRSRGLTRSSARNMLMFAFAEDVASCVDPSMLGSVDGQEGLQNRIIQRLQNLVPQGDRAIKGEFQSS
jgi:Fe-S cluster assembly scaffold protein SufB